MSSFQITGKLIAIEKTEQVSDKFRKRTFVLETVEEINGNNYTNYAKMQLVQAKCDIIDSHRIGDTITASFNIKGNKWERDGKVNYISNMDCWKIEAAQGQNNQPQQPRPTPATDIHSHNATNSRPPAPDGWEYDENGNLVQSPPF